MAGKSDSFENSLLAHIFDSGSLPTFGTDLYVSLHTADPTEAGSGAEANYTGYARVAVSRTTGWTVTGSTVNPAAAIVFGACTAGSNTITHFAIWTASTAGTMLYFGACTPSITVTNGITPQLTTATSITED